MANTLHDRGVDVLYQSEPDLIIAVIKELIKAGWPSNLIDANFEAAIHMAVIRQRNEERQQ